MNKGDVILKFKSRKNKFIIKSKHNLLYKIVDLNNFNSIGVWYFLATLDGNVVIPLYKDWYFSKRDIYDIKLNPTKEYGFCEESESCFSCEEEGIINNKSLYKYVYKLNKEKFDNFIIYLNDPNRNINILYIKHKMYDLCFFKDIINSDFEGSDNLGIF